MSGNQDSPDNKPKKQGYSTIILLVVLAVVFFSYKTVNHKEPTIPEMPLTKEEAVSEVSAPSPEPASGTATEETAQAPVAADEPATSQEPPAAEESGSVETENTEETAESSEIEQPTATEAPPALDIAKLSVPRTMGKADAPLKVTEYASFTCPHCAHFHQDSFKKLQTDFIDTGKLHLTFSDFPTNLPAVQASKVARCIPDENYFNFVSLLFQTQDDWSTKPEYQKLLKQNALIAGIDEKTFEACINSEDLQKAILTEVEKANKEKNVDGVPTLIFDDGQLISGNMPYEEMKKIIEDKLSKLEKK
jgi:protein-disulfide isomerase